MIRDAFDLAKEKAKDRGGAIIFIDEVRRTAAPTAGAAERVVGGRPCTWKTERHVPVSAAAISSVRTPALYAAVGPITTTTHHPTLPSAPAQIDAIGTKRRDDEQSGDREVQRTMLELLNQLDGFSSSNKIKVIAATNRADTLDPALLR
jgi:hypothetical protein